ncbi:uncharacterized protein G2W53_013141 [Senna tora]|uniref:Uncharacterized protein n=1 Tax=Senna tora TaxID=362788 RepID=A0A834WR28_9FABA|nr:uncharacterized protein G2W53_013141 [Senna tora]
MGEIDRNPCLKPQHGLKKPIEKTLIPISIEDDSPIRAIVCLKRSEDIKRFEESEDCFILEFDPFEPVNLSKLSLEKNDTADAEISVVAEKGKVACRDFPHSRHLCIKYPFNTKSHESYCEMCYCYVCDSAAPCNYWNSHCHAENVDYWKEQRKMKRQITS